MSGHAEPGIAECLLRNLPVGILTEKDRRDLRFLLETRAELLAALKAALAEISEDGESIGAIVDVIEDAGRRAIAKAERR